jgi:hypothetical protein
VEFHVKHFSYLHLLVLNFQHVHHLNHGHGQLTFSKVVLNFVKVRLNTSKFLVAGNCEFLEFLTILFSILLQCLDVQLQGF